MTQPTPRPDARRFEDLGLSQALIRAVRDKGYVHPTPIQELAIPHVLTGRDVLGCAQTGTGKTAAFVLPILHRLAAQPAASAHVRHDAHRKLRVLVLSPTRELATQIGDAFAAYGRNTGLRHTVIFGGVGQNAQVSALRRGVDILVATPGRLVDLMSQRLVDFSHIQVAVLDEVDRMLDQGFLPAVRQIFDKLPHERQTLVFSATMPAEIQPLADRMLRNPVRVEVAPVASTPDRVEQSVYFVDQQNKRALLTHVLDAPDVTRAVVFTRTKHGADRVAKQLSKSDVGAEAIHGGKSQNARERALARFRKGAIRVLVATDVASRGIDIQGVSHVVNYDIPNDPEGYVHRIGRTARAGSSGVAISFCSADERGDLAGIERIIQRQVPVVADHPYHLPELVAAPMGRSQFGRARRGTQHGAASNDQRRGFARRRRGPRGRVQHA